MLLYSFIAVMANFFIIFTVYVMWQSCQVVGFQRRIARSNILSHLKQLVYLIENLSAAVDGDAVFRYFNEISKQKY